jgi:predicted HD superfamily hydrolase involved in NAD metabolism
MARSKETLLLGLTSGESHSESPVEFLKYHQKYDVAVHSQKVAHEARKIAGRFGLDAQKAYMAGTLHDIGQVIPWEDMAETAHDLNIEILPEESRCPSLLHQKLSRIMATEIFDIKDLEVLNAIECHSTLWSNPSSFEMVLFVADKLQWDPEHGGVFLDEMRGALEQSLEKAALTYIDFLLGRESHAIVIHPWSLAAFQYLRRFV